MNFTQRFIQSITASAITIGNEEKLSAQKGLIDGIATAFAAQNNEVINQLIQSLLSEQGVGQSPIIGYEQKLSARDAALVNGYILHYLDYDDVHSDVRGHASSVIIPSLLATANGNQRSYDHFLESYIIGIEVAARIGRTIGSQHYEKGWHTSSTIGIIGAAAANAYYLGLDQNNFANAIGIAITEMSGLRAQFGTDVKPLHIGLAAQKAYMAVKYSEFNVVDGNKDMLSALFATYSEQQDPPDSLIKEDNESWAIVNPGLWFKLHPCCSANYHAIDAVKNIQKKYALPIETIDTINVIFPLQGDAALKFTKPTNGIEGRFSVEYVIAKLLYNHQLTLEDFFEKEISTEIQSLMSKVRRTYDETIKAQSNALPKGRFTIVEIRDNLGEIYRERIDTPKGSPNHPLTMDEIIEKLTLYAPKHASNIQQLFNLNNTGELITYIVTGG